jgi:hypothetical protein
MITVEGVTKTYGLATSWREPTRFSLSRNEAREATMNEQTGATARLDQRSAARGEQPMCAVVQHRYGIDPDDVFRLETVDRPAIGDHTTVGSGSRDHPAEQSLGLVGACPAAPDAARLAVVAAGGFAVVVLFQLALALGAPLGAAAWGGEHSGQLPSNLRVASAFSAAFWSLAALAVLARGRIELSPIPFPASRWGTWALVGVLTVGTIANLASSINCERLGWAPLVLALAFICLKLARTHGARP